jgi:hypothetical protein
MSLIASKKKSIVKVINTTCSVLFALNVDVVIRAVNIPHIPKYAPITVPEGDT